MSKRVRYHSVGADISIMGDTPDKCGLSAVSAYETELG